jgi:Transposase DDE domain group 1
LNFRKAKLPLKSLSKRLESPRRGSRGLIYDLPATARPARIQGVAGFGGRSGASPKEDGKLRRFKEFFDGAKSWSRVERIIARIEVGAEGPDTRFIVTNLKVRNARVLYEDVYCRRGQAENHIKSWKTHLAACRGRRGTRRWAASGDPCSTS